MSRCIEPCEDDHRLNKTRDLLPRTFCCFLYDSRFASPTLLSLPRALVSLLLPSFLPSYYYNSWRVKWGAWGRHVQWEYRCQAAYGGACLMEVCPVTDGPSRSGNFAFSQSCIPSSSSLHSPQFPHRWIPLPPAFFFVFVFFQKKKKKLFLTSLLFILFIKTFNYVWLQKILKN